MKDTNILIYNCPGEMCKLTCKLSTLADNLKQDFPVILGTLHIQQTTQKLEIRDIIGETYEYPPLIDATTLSAFDKAREELTNLHKKLEDFGNCLNDRFAKFNRKLDIAKEKLDANDEEFSKPVREMDFIATAVASEKLGDISEWIASVFEKLRNETTTRIKELHDIKKAVRKALKGVEDCRGKWQTIHGLETIGAGIKTLKAKTDESIGKLCEQFKEFHELCKEYNDELNSTRDAFYLQTQNKD